MKRRRSVLALVGGRLIPSAVMSPGCKRSISCCRRPVKSAMANGARLPARTPRAVGAKRRRQWLARPVTGRWPECRPNRTKGTDTKKPRPDESKRGGDSGGTTWPWLRFSSRPQPTPKRSCLVPAAAVGVGVGVGVGLGSGRCRPLVARIIKSSFAGAGIRKGSMDLGLARIDFQACDQPR